MDLIVLNLGALLGFRPFKKNVYVFILPYYVKNTRLYPNFHIFMAFFTNYNNLVSYHKFFIALCILTASKLPW